MDSLESKKLREMLEKFGKISRTDLRNADDMKRVHQAQARLNLIDEITTQFFTEQKPPNERTTLRI